MNKKQFQEFSYSLKPYIEKLRLEGKEEELVQVFQANYPDLEISYLYINQVRAKLMFRKHSYSGVCWRIYSLSDFDCKLTDDYANVDERSEHMCSDSNVKNIYISFMEQTFSDYKNKRSEQQNLHSEKDTLSI